MICFEVWVNGEKFCVAGVGECGVLVADVLWGQGGPPQKPHLHEKAHLNVTGVVNKEHIYWTEKIHNLDVGDEVTLKIVEADVADEPVRKEPRKRQEQK